MFFISSVLLSFSIVGYQYEKNVGTGIFHSEINPYAIYTNPIILISSGIFVLISTILIVIMIVKLVKHRY